MRMRERAKNSLFPQEKLRRHYSTLSRAQPYYSCNLGAPSKADYQAVYIQNEYESLKLMEAASATQGPRIYFEIV